MENLTRYTEVVEFRVSLITTPGAWLNKYWWQFSTPGTGVALIPSPVLKEMTYSRVSRKHLVFWSCVVGLIARDIGRETKAILRTQRGNHFFKLVVNICVWVIEVLKALDTDLCKIESNRDPPKIFIPIPKIESNGCARSDSLLLAYF